MRRWFNLHQTAVCVEAPDDKSAAAVTRYLEPFATAQLGIPDYTIAIEPGPLDASPAAKEPASVEIGHGIYGHLEINDFYAYCSAPNQFSIMSEHAINKSTIKIAETCTRTGRGVAAIHTIDRMLEATGRQLLHGAALLFPNQSRAILIFGKSGTGKTTTCLALASQGYKLLTDDAIVLEAKTPPPHSVWGLPRPAKIHRRTGELLPFLEPILLKEWDEAGEQAVPLEVLSTVVGIGGHTPYPIAALATLGERKNGAHAIVKLTKAEAMLHIALDNLHSLPGSALLTQANRFHALGSTIAAAPTFAIHVGCKLSSLGDELQQHIIQ